MTRGALLLVLLQLALVASQVALKISSDNPPTFTDELKEPKFIVGFLPEGSSVPAHVRVLPMTDTNGTKYDCYLPSVQGDEDTSSSELDTALLTEQSPEELLDSLVDWCGYRVEDWWTYEVCYKKHVRQYHKEHKKVTAEFVLGKYSEQDSDANSVQIDTSDVSGEVKFVSQQYVDGDVCALTEQPRVTEVRYVCRAGAADSVISSIKETASCVYRITVATPRICKHPQFRTEPSPVGAIKCIPRVGQAAAAAAGALPSSASAGQECTAEGEGEGACAAEAGGSSGRSSSGEVGEDGSQQEQDEENWTASYPAAEEDGSQVAGDWVWAEQQGAKAADDEEEYADGLDDDDDESDTHSKSSHDEL